MKFVDEFRDGTLIRAAAKEIRRLAGRDRHYRIMEVCGGHTHSIYRYGLRTCSPNIDLIHGPVCVLAMGHMDNASPSPRSRTSPLPPSAT